MKKKKYEYIQRIENAYVSDDCVQLMIPHCSNNGITILNSDGMTFHYVPNSRLFVNKYASDERKNQFPYSQMPTHTRIVGLRKMEYVNQLLDFNRVYIEIADNMVKEEYVVKDGNEALLATKYIIPNQESPQYMKRDKVIELLKSANGGIFLFNGSRITDPSILIPTEEKILEWHKEQLMEGLSITQDFYRKLNNLTINDVPRNTTVLEEVILVSINDNEIKRVRSITVNFMGADNYKVEIFDFPITIYSLEHMQVLEQTNSRKMLEPKFLRFLNKNINNEEIESSKQLVLKMKRASETRL